MFRPFQFRIRLPPSPDPSGSTYTSRSSLFRFRPTRRPPFAVLILAFTLLSGIYFTVLHTHPTGHLYTASTDAASNDAPGGWGEWVEWGELGDIGSRLGSTFEKGKEVLGVGSCRGWDPEQGEENDPEGCLRARQYRQVQRVLRRENLREQSAYMVTCP